MSDWYVIPEPSMRGPHWLFEDDFFLPWDFSGILKKKYVRPRKRKAR